MKVDEARAPTVTAQGGRRWIYPERRDGAYSRKRRAVGYSLLLVYLLLPHLSWAGRPLLRIDIMSKMFYVFGGVFRLNDIAYFAIVVILACLLLFWVTSLRGRLWCGYACPQTVFIDWVIRPIEEWTEGKANRRKVQDSGKLTLELSIRKLAKHGLFFLIAGLVANNFLLYFVSPEQLTYWVSSSPEENPIAFGFMGLNLAAFYFNFAWFREQFCAFLCPYARLQAIMIDQDTPTVAYDYKRGEPRGKHQGGDCIDCNLCVRVCPTGIDIRKGLQLECVQCFRCTDACNGIMKNLKRPEGLIRNTSAAALSKTVPPPKLRLRPWLYGIAFSTLAAAFLCHLWLRPPVKTTITRMSNAPISKFDDGRSGNMFRIRFENQTDKPQPMAILSQSPQVEVICGVCSGSLLPFEEKVAVVMIIFQNTKSPDQAFLEVEASQELLRAPLIH